MEIDSNYKQNLTNLRTNTVFYRKAMIFLVLLFDLNSISGRRAKVEPEGTDNRPWWPLLAAGGCGRTQESSQKAQHVGKSRPRTVNGNYIE